MKKVLCFAAVATILFAACQKTTVVGDYSSPQEIGIFSVSKTMTKAGAINTTTFPTDYPMKVSAYLAEGATANGEYFENKTFIHDTDAWVGGQYWPISTAKINFFAAAPETSDVTTTFNTIAESKKTATITVTNNVTNQDDVMYALAQGSHTAGAEYTAVPMAFKHALSWICFSATSGNTGTGAPTIVVNNITVKNVAFDGTGTLTVTEANYTSTNSANVKSENVTPTWTVTDKTSSKEIAAASFSEGMLIIPETYNPTFTINYTVTQNGTSFTYDYNYNPGSSTWEAGKKYSYNITITLQEIKITPTVDTWGTATDLPVNITK